MKSEAQFCRTAQNDLYYSPNRMNDYNIFLSIVTSRARLSEMKSLEKENQRLKKIVADLELDKRILKESLDYLKPKA